MKKIALLLVLLNLLALAGIAHAGERAGAISISPYVGGYVWDDSQPLRENRPIYGLRLGYDLSSYFGLELNGSYARAQLRSVDSHVNVLNYGLDLIFNMFPHSVVVPYLAAGGGATHIHYHRVAGDRPSTDATANVGGGLKFFMNDDLALRMDGRFIKDFRGRHTESLDNWIYSLGLSWVFGGAKEAAEEVTEAAPAPAAAPAPEQAAPAAPPVQAAEPTPGHYKYCIALHTEFDIDKAVIRDQYRDDIARVGDFMKKYPTTTAVIEGHTDNVGTYNHNMELSQRRAEAVVDYLVNNFGIDRSRLTAKGYGFTRPVADNATDEGKQKNRRIEAIIDCAFDVQKIEPPERLCMSLVMDFDSGSAAIKPEYRSEIAKVADYMKQYPTTTATIEGHTDLTGDEAANMRLSQQRAENVVNYLVDNFGIDRSRLSAKGYGSSRRIAYNTPDGKAHNRRINAIIDCVVRK
jgi:OmpA-OmpF porin, OOP family